MTAVTVCQLPDQLDEATWTELCTVTTGTELVVLPEMPFHRWLASTSASNEEDWMAAVKAHEAWEMRLGELGATNVLWTHPVSQPRVNEGRFWQEDSSHAVHRKHYLPDEPGYWEASWYAAAPERFVPFDTAIARIGMAICTDMWFFQHARSLGQAGVDILAVPRATPADMTNKWIVGGQTAAVVSGAWCVSSNRGSDPFGGGGWVIEPEAGEIIGVTSKQEPFLKVEIDLELAQRAKTTYPRYVKE